MKRHHERDPSLYRHMLPSYMCADPADAEAFLIQTKGRWSDEKIATMTHVPVRVVAALRARLEGKPDAIEREKRKIVEIVLVARQ